MCGCDAVAMSNERSASAPNLRIDGADINHQFSKSLEFEADFSEYVATQFRPTSLFLASAPVFRDRDRPEIFKASAILRDISELQYGISGKRVSERASLVLRLPEMPLRIPRACAVCRQTGPGCDFRPQSPRRGSPGDGFAELCGLQKHKPFECVGETFESAAVMSTLGEHPAWRDDRVVRRLNRGIPCACANWSRAISGIAGGQTTPPGSCPVYGDTRCVRLTSAHAASPYGGSAAKAGPRSGFCANFTRACPSSS